MDDEEDFGPCCVCEGFENVRNIVMLDKKNLELGSGWGCLVCHLAMDGALAVVCDDCIDAEAAPRFAVVGYLANKQRVKIEELTIEHKHDMRFHLEDE